MSSTKEVTIAIDGLAAVILSIVVSTLVTAWVDMLLWGVVASVFGFVTISFWQSLIVSLVLCTLYIIKQ